LEFSLKSLIFYKACGLGKALAIRFLKLNAIVVLVDINHFELKNTCNQLEDELNIFNKNGKRFFSYVCDVASCDQVKSLAKKIKNDVGNVKILINNAGVVNGDVLTNLSEKQIRRTFDVNVLSHFWTCKVFLESMVGSNSGHFVCISSVMGFMGGYKLTDYCSSKFAAYGFTESLRIELKTINSENKIITSIVCPFHIQTKMFRGVKFTSLNWLKISMTAEYAADCIIHGILLDKEIIYVPRMLPNICHIVKG
jgi:all-trans-retinol dehydrogenase (NAD+)